MRKALERVLVAAIYLFTNVLFGYAVESNFWKERKEALSGARDTGAKAASIRRDRGLLIPGITEGGIQDKGLPALLISSDQRGRGSTGLTSRPPRVVLLQDIHHNEEAQRSLAAMLRHLAQSHRGPSPLTIGAEGAFEPFHFFRFSGFSDAAVREEVASYFLKENRLSAASYFGISSLSDRARIIGIDDREHHRANIESYLRANPHRRKQEDALRAQKTRVADAVSTSSNAALRAFRDASERYHDGTMPLAGYIEKIDGLLKNDVDWSGRFPSLDRFRRLSALEKSINFPRVENEKESLVRSLGQRLDERNWREFMELTTGWMLQRVSEAEFYRRFGILLQDAGVPISKTSEFGKYVQYVLAADSIEPDQLIAEVRALERFASAGVCRNQSEQQWMEQDRRRRLTGKLIRFALTPEEWKEYKSPEEPVKFESGLDDFEAFYEEADARSARMVERFLSESGYPRNSDGLLGVILAGGFHTPEIRRLLEERGISCTVWRPTVRRAPRGDGTDYLSLFEREKTPLDKLFAGSTLFLAPPETSVGTAAGRANEAWVVAAMLARHRTAEAAVDLPRTGVRVVDAAHELLRWGPVHFQVNGLPAPGFRVLESKSLPSGERLRFLEPKRSAIAAMDSFILAAKREWKTAFLREAWFPLIAIALAGWTAVPLWAAVGLNAFLFAAFHKNKSNAQFAGRTFGAMVVLAAAIYSLQLSGVGNPLVLTAAGVVSPVLTISSLLMTAGLFHAAWNALAPSPWRLELRSGEEENQTSPVSLRFGAGESPHREELNREFRALWKHIQMLPGGPAVRVLDAAVLFAHLRETDVSSNRRLRQPGDVPLAPALVLGLQRAEESLWEQRLRQGLSKVANRDRRRDLISRETRILNRRLHRLYRLTETGEWAIAHIIDNGHPPFYAEEIPRSPTPDVTVRILRVETARRVAVRKINAATSSEEISDELIDALPESQKETGREMRARWRLEEGTRKSDIALIAQAVPDLHDPQIREQAVTRLNALVGEAVDRATSSADINGSITSALDALGESEERDMLVRRVENKRNGLAAAERILAAPHGAAIASEDADAVQRLLLPDDPARRSAERWMTARREKAAAESFRRGAATDDIGAMAAVVPFLASGHRRKAEEILERSLAKKSADVEDPGVLSEVRTAVLEFPGELAGLKLRWEDRLDDQIEQTAWRLFWAAPDAKAAEEFAEYLGEPAHRERARARMRHLTVAETLDFGPTELSPAERLTAVNNAWNRFFHDVLTAGEPTDQLNAVVRLRRWETRMADVGLADAVVWDPAVERSVRDRTVNVDRRFTQSAGMIQRSLVKFADAWRLGAAHRHTLDSDGADLLDRAASDIAAAVEEKNWEKALPWILQSAWYLAERLFLLAEEDAQRSTLESEWGTLLEEAGRWSPGLVEKARSIREKADHRYARLRAESGPGTRAGIRRLFIEFDREVARCTEFIRRYEDGTSTSEVIAGLSASRITSEGTIDFSRVVHALRVVETVARANSNRSFFSRHPDAKEWFDSAIVSGHRLLASAKRYQQSLTRPTDDAGLASLSPARTPAPVAAPSPTPSPAAGPKPTPKPDPVEENPSQALRHYVHVAAFAAALLMVGAVVWAAPDAAAVMVRWSGFGHTASSAVAGVGFIFGGTKITYLAVRIALIAVEGVGRTFFVLGRWFAGAHAPVAFRGSPQHGSSSNAVRRHGVEVDFLSTAGEVKAAIQRRFSKDSYLIDDEPLKGLSPGQLFALYYRLDALSDRAGKEAERASARAAAPVPWWRSAALAVALFPVHMGKFLKNYFFETDLARIAYQRRGRFENQFASAEEARLYVEAAVRVLKESNEEFSFAKRVFVWYGRNNIFLAGLAGYLYRRLRITVFGIAGGWMVAGLGAVFPWLADASLDPWIHGWARADVIPETPGVAHATVVSHPGVYARRALAHLSFSFQAVARSFFTALGLLFHAEFFRLRRLVFAGVVNPFARAVHHPSVDARTGNSALEPLVPRDWNFPEAHAALVGLRRFVDTRLAGLPVADRKPAVLGIIDVLAWANAYASIQEGRGRDPLFVREERDALRDDIDGVQHALSAILIDSEKSKLAAALERKTALTHRWLEQEMPTLSTPLVWRLAARRAVERQFLGRLLHSMAGMWSLGAEIALVTQAAGDAGAVAGAAAGMADDGRWLGASVVDLLEGEHGSAMSVIDDAGRWMMGKDAEPMVAVETPSPDRELNARTTETGSAPLSQSAEDGAKAQAPPDPRAGLSAGEEPSRWVPERAFVSAARWAVLEREMREAAERFVERTGQPASLPEIPVSTERIPILARIIHGEMRLVYTDGSSDPEKLVPFDAATRTYAPRPGKEFMPLILDLSPRGSYVDEKGNPLLDRKGEPMPATGFRPVHDKSVNAVSVRWRTPDGTMSEFHPERGTAKAMEPGTGFEVLFEDPTQTPAARLAKAVRDRDTALRRSKVAEELLSSQTHVALLVDRTTYDVLDRYASVEDIPTDANGVPAFGFYASGADGVLEEFDPMVYPDRQADEIRPAGEKDKIILFTRKGDETARVARRDAEVSRADRLAAFSLMALPGAGAAGAPVFMLAQDRSGRIEAWPTIDIAVQRMMELGIRGRVVGQLTGDPYLPPLTEIEQTNPALYTNDSPVFADKWRAYYRQSGERGAYALRLDAAGRDAKSIPFTKEGMKSLMRTAEPDRRGRGVRLHIASAGAIDELTVNAEQWNRFRSQNALPLPDGSWLVRMAYRDGVISERISAEEHANLLRRAEHVEADGVTIKFNLALKVKDGHVVQSLDDPDDVQRLLTKQSLIYVLSNGLRLPPHRLPPNLAGRGVSVTDIVDSDDGTSIRLGSEWLRLQFLMNEAVRAEQRVRERSGGVQPPRVIEIIGNQSIIRAYHPSYEIGFQKAVDDLRRRVDAAANPAQRQRELDQLRRTLQERSYVAWDPVLNTFKKIVLKGSSLDRDRQSRSEWADLAKARALEGRRRSGTGGEIVISRGDALRDERFAAQDLDTALAWKKQIEAEIRLQNGKNPAALRDLRKENQKAEARIKQLSGELERIHKRLGPGGDSQERSFTPRFTHADAARGQKIYFDRLRDELRRAPDPTDAASARTRRILEYCLTNNSYFDEHGNEHIVIAPTDAADARARRIEAKVQRSQEMLAVQSHLLKGGGVALRWTLDRVDGALRSDVSVESVAAGRAALERFAGKTKAALAAEKDPERKASLAARLARAVSFGEIDDTDADGRGERWQVLGDSFAKGGAIIEHSDAIDESNPRSYDVVTLDEAKKMRSRCAGELKDRIRRAKDDAERDRLTRLLRRTLEEEVFSLVEKNRRSRVMMVHSVESAEKHVDRCRGEEAAADAIRNAAGTVAIVTDGDAVSIVSDPDRIRRWRRALTEELHRSYTEYRRLREDRSDAGRKAAADLAGTIKKMETGTWMEAGKQIVFQYTHDQAREGYARFARDWRKGSPDGTVVMDENGMEIGRLYGGGSHEVFRESRVVTLDPEGRSLVETRTYAGGSMKPGVNADPEMQKGRLLRVERTLANEDRSIRYLIRGTLIGEEFRPLTTTVDSLAGEYGEIGVAGASTAYRYIDGQPVESYGTEAKAGERDNSRLGWSRVISTPDEILRTGTVVYELQDALGNRWSEKTDGRGLLLAKTEGTTGPEGFKPAREIRLHYDNESFALLRIPSHSDVVDAATGRRLGWSRLLTSFDEFIRDGYIRYERWDELTQTMVWEEKDADGRLLRKYALQPEESESGTRRYRPVNVTLFRYDDQRSLSRPGTPEGELVEHGLLGLADRAYTFKTDDKGNILGTVRELPDGSVLGDYFEYTEIAMVVRTKAGIRVLYRVSVRNGDQRDFEQFQELKNPEGWLLEKHVGHKSGSVFVPEEITFHEYDPSDERGRHGVATRSVSYHVSFNGPPMEAPDFSGVGHEAFVQRVPLENGATCELVRKEWSDLLEREDGAISYRKTGVVYASGSGKSPVPVAVPLSIDVLDQGLPVEIRRLGPDGKTAVGSSKLEYDAAKNVVRAVTVDVSDHPSVGGLPAPTGSTGVVKEEVNRRIQGVDVNPDLPDLPARFWRVYDTSQKNIRGEEVFKTERREDVYGKPIVEIYRKTSESGDPQTMVALHISDRDVRDQAIAVKNGESTVPFFHAQTPAGADGNAPADVSGWDVLYFSVMPAATMLPVGERQVRATFTDRSGRSVTLDSALGEFWPANGQEFEVRPDHRVQVHADSVFQGKKFLYVVPVRELAQRGLDITALKPRMGLSVKSVDGNTVPLIASPVQRAGRLEVPLSKKDLSAAPSTRPALAGFTASETDGKPAAEKKNSFHLHSGAGQQAIHDATRGTKEGFGIDIKGPDNRLLGVVRVHRFASAVTGLPKEERWLVLYDDAGTYPIGKVKLSRTAARLDYDRANVIRIDVEEDGKTVRVFGRDPATNPQYPVETVFRIDSVDPSVASEIRVGEFSRLPAVGAVSARNTWINRLFNTPYRLFWRSDVRNAAERRSPRERLAHVEKAFQRIDPELLSDVSDRLDRMIMDLPSSERPRADSDGETSFAWGLLVPWRWQGAAFWAVALWPVWLLIRSWRSARQWRAKRAAIDRDHAARGRTRFLLYDEATVQRALDRMRRNVLRVQVRGTGLRGEPILLVNDADTEGLFLNNLMLIYFLIVAWTEKAPIHEAEKSAMLEDLDRFTLAFWKYLTIKVGQGSDPGVARYTLPGKFDPQIWDRLEPYLASFREEIRRAYLADLETWRHTRGPSTGEPRVAGVFRSILERTLVSAPSSGNGDMPGFDTDAEGTWKVDEPAFYDHIKRTRLESVPAVFVPLGRYLVKALPVLWGLAAFKGGVLAMPAEGALLLGAGLLTAAIGVMINAVTESRAIRSARVSSPGWGRARALLPAAAAAMLTIFLGSVDGIAFPLFSLVLSAIALMALETLGITLPRRAVLGGNRSLAGVAWYYHIRRPYDVGRPRAILLMSLVNATFVATSLTLGSVVAPWFIAHYLSGDVFRTALALVIFVSRMPLLHHGINLGWRFLFSWWAPSHGAGIPPHAAADPDHKVAVVHIGGQTMGSQALTRGGTVMEVVNKFMGCLGLVRGKMAQGRDALNLIFLETARDTRLSKSRAGQFMNDPVAAASAALEALFSAETAADNGRGTTLWCLRQMTDSRMPLPLRVGTGLSPEESAMVEAGWKLRRSLVELLGTKAANDSINTAINFVEMAEAAADAGLAGNLIFYNGFNQYQDHANAKGNPLTMDVSNRTEAGQRVKHAALVQYVSEREGRPGARAYVGYNHTTYGLKSSAMHEIFMEETELPNIKSILISDRNAAMLNVRRFVQKDLRRIILNPAITVVVANRNTTYVLDALGRTSFSVEGGHGQSMRSLSDIIGTGWMNLMRVTHWDVYREFGDPSASFRTFGPREDDWRRDFGIIGFSPNAIGISEDYWAVLQQFHTMIALGRKPEVALSEALAHKMRESEHYSEWEAAPPRWSSGLLQSIESLLNQQANEFGPNSYFEKEARQTNADHYLLGPLVLFDLVMMPLSVVFDLSPFVGISLLFWVPGIVINQISTLNALLADVRHMGFWPGVGQWLSDRVSDSLLFSARTVRDALAQFFGYTGPTFEFKISGTGGEKPNPWLLIFPFVFQDEIAPEPKDGPKLSSEEAKAEREKRRIHHRVPVVLLSEVMLTPQTFLQKILVWEGLRFHVRERTVTLKVGEYHQKAGGLWQHLAQPFSFLNTFLFGVMMLAVNLFAMSRLDATNAVMLVLSLWFAVGVAFGPMLKAAKKGTVVWNGWGDALAKSAGALLGFGWLIGFAGVAVVALTVRLEAFSIIGAAVAVGVLLTAGTLAVAAMMTAQRRFAERRRPGGVRIASEMHRGFWTVLLLFGWFAMVPMHPILRFDLVPNHPLVFSIAELAVVAAAAALVVMGLVILGHVVSTHQMRLGEAPKAPREKDEKSKREALVDWADWAVARSVRRPRESAADRYLRLVREHRATRGADTGVDASIDGLATQIVTFLQQRAFRYAHDAMDDIQTLLDWKEANIRFRGIMASVHKFGIPSGTTEREISERFRRFRGAAASEDLDAAMEVIDELSRLAPVAVPGAIGLWSRTGVKPPTAGFLEGVGTGVLGWAMMIFLVPEFGFGIQASAAAFVSALGIAVALFAIHRLLGVHLGGGRVGSGWRISFRAMRNASHGLWAIPVIFFGLAWTELPDFWIVLAGALVGGLAHAWANRAAMKTQAGQRDLSRSTMESLVPAQPVLGTPDADPGEEPARRWATVLRRARRLGVAEYTTERIPAITGMSSRVILVTRGERPEEVAGEIESLLRLFERISGAENGRFAVVVGNGLRDRLPNAAAVPVVEAGELRTAVDAERRLLGKSGTGETGFEIIVPLGARMPPVMVELLHTRWRSRARMWFVDSLSLGSPAWVAPAGALGRWFRLEVLARAQA